MTHTINLTFRRLVLVAAIGSAALLAGCSGTPKNPGNSTYDFGATITPATDAMPAGTPMEVLVVTEVTGVAALDNERMYYRLAYADPLRARNYSNSRWSSTPLSMVTQRIKSRLSQSGIKVLSPTDAAAGMPILRMEIDDFTHTFESPAQSYGQLVLRASLFQGHKLIDQRVFNQKTPAASLDAGGGARALAESTDAAAAAMLVWLAKLQLPKQ